MANTDTDGDGLYNIEEINTYLSDPNLADSDSDGLSDGDEVLLSNIEFNVNIDNSAAVSMFLQRLGLMTTDEVQDLRPGSILIEIQDGTANINMNMETSSNLSDWNVEDVITKQISIDPSLNKRFFRFKIAE